MLLWSSIVLAGVTLALPYLPLVWVIGLVPLPASLLVAIGAVTALYVGATELLKICSIGASVNESSESSGVQRDGKTHGGAK